MKERIVVLGLAVLAAGLLMSDTPVEAASRKHLVVVYPADNTGQGQVTVDRGKLHPYGAAGAAKADCSGAVCGATYAAGARVTLTATPAAGSTFAGWGGECSGTSPTCVVSMSRSRDVLARFGK